jgi:hypothetical protein
LVIYRLRIPSLAFRNLIVAAYEINSGAGRYWYLAATVMTAQF